MATSHPYISGAGNVTALIAQLRKNFPASVTADTIKKFGLASNNESYLINAIRFIGLIDEEGKRTDKAKIFSIHKEEEFQAAFEKLVKEAYKDLFETLGPEAWKLDRDSLVNYFRQADQTSDMIGRRQTGVFQAFASIAGYGDASEGPKAKPARAKAKAAPKSKPAAKGKMKKEFLVEPEGENEENAGKRGGVALTVRIEINLPAGGTQDTYDAIFKSIKANLIDE